MNILEILRETAISLGVHTALQKTAADATVEGGKKIIQKIMDNDRAVLLTIIRTGIANSGPFPVMWERYEKTLQENGGMPGEENRWVTLLSRLVVALKKEPEKLKKVFLDLENINDNQFKEVLYFLEHDPVQQIFKKIIISVESNTGPITRAIKSFRELLAEGGVK